MIGKASVFAIAMLAPGLAFAANSASTGAAPAVATHDAATTGTTAKADVKPAAKSDVKSDTTAKAATTVKTAKAKGHKNKAVPAAEQKTESKS